MKNNNHYQEERRKFNSFSRPYTIKQVNDFFKQKGYNNIKLEEEDGIFIFKYEDKISESLVIEKVKELTFGQWLDELEYFLYVENK